MFNNISLQPKVILDLASLSTAAILYKSVIKGNVKGFMFLSLNLFICISSNNSISIGRFKVNLIDVLRKSR